MSKQPGYHLTDIPKGEFGEASKIIEEALEFKDSLDQNCTVMSLMELSDLIGAIKQYLFNYHSGITLKDLEKMADITRRAFVNGHRN